MFAPFPRFVIPKRSEVSAVLHDSQLTMIAPLQPTADGGLVARILVVEVALEKPFFSWNHNRRDEADSWNERYEQPKVIQPN